MRCILMRQAMMPMKMRFTRPKQARSCGTWLSGCNNDRTTMQILPITQIKPNPKNPRVIRDKKFEKLKKSIQDFPDMLNKRPLVCFTDKDGKVVVLGGNMRLKAAKELGLKELPVVLADDWTEEQKAEFLIKDNVGFGEWAWDELQADWDVEQLEAWGLDVPAFEEPEEENEKTEAYTSKIDAPIYEAKNEKPEITALYESDKYANLIAEIESSNISNDIKIFLKVAASRHIVFNYENIADFYAHSNKEVQELMEKSALVIIDFNKAIEFGFTELNEKIANQYKVDYE